MGMGGKDPITIYGGPTVMQAAIMCQHVYGDVEVMLEGGWKVSNAYKSTQINLTNDETGFKSQLYERTMPNGSKQYNYVFAGTEDLKDWKNNGQQLVGKSKQYKQAIFNAKVLNENLEGSLSFSGHSLGGGLATVAGLATERSVIAFNPAWMSMATAKEYELLLIDPFQMNYIVGGEILDFLQNTNYGREYPGPLGVQSDIYHLLLPKGEKKYLQPDGYINPIELHKMPAVIKALEKSGYNHSRPSEKVDASENINFNNKPAIV
jgi:hypothetical protein